MKKLFVAAAMLIAAYASEAQSLDIHNITNGQVHVKVYASASYCSATLDYVNIVLPGMSSKFVDLTDPAVWNGGAPPASFVLTHATVSRNPACTGSTGWGTVAGTCSASSATGTQYYDEITVGDPVCSYVDQGCVEISTNMVKCDGFLNGDVIGVRFLTSPNSDVTIKVDY